jgi:hypothetical protein
MKGSVTTRAIRNSDFFVVEHVNSSGKATQEALD